MFFVRLLSSNFLFINASLRIIATRSKNFILLNSILKASLLMKKLIFASFFLLI